MSAEKPQLLKVCFQTLDHCRILVIFGQGRGVTGQRGRQRHQRHLHLHASVILQQSIFVVNFKRIILALRWPITTTFLLGVVVGFGSSVRCRWFRKVSSIQPCPHHLHLPSKSCAPRSVDPQAGAICQAQGSEVDPAPRVKVWCLGEELGPAPGDPDLLSTCNADSRSARM